VVPSLFLTIQQFYPLKGQFITKYFLKKNYIVLEKKFTQRKNTAQHILQVEHGVVKNWSYYKATVGTTMFVL
jgi:hypothetical protein